MYESRQQKITVCLIFFNVCLLHWSSVHWVVSCDKTKLFRKRVFVWIISRSVQHFYVEWCKVYFISKRKWTPVNFYKTKFLTNILTLFVECKKRFWFQGNKKLFLRIRFAYRKIYIQAWLASGWTKTILLAYLSRRSLFKTWNFISFLDLYISDDFQSIFTYKWNLMASH